MYDRRGGDVRSSSGVMVAAARSLYELGSDSGGKMVVIMVVVLMVVVIMVAVVARW